MEGQCLSTNLKPGLMILFTSPIVPTRTPHSAPSTCCALHAFHIAQPACLYIPLPCIAFHIWHSPSGPAFTFRTYTTPHTLHLASYGHSPKLTALPLLRPNAAFSFIFQLVPTSDASTSSVPSDPQRFTTCSGTAKCVALLLHLLLMHPPLVLSLSPSIRLASHTGLRPWCPHPAVICRCPWVVSVGVRGLTTLAHTFIGCGICYIPYTTANVILVLLSRKCHG